MFEDVSNTLYDFGVVAHDTGISLSKSFGIIGCDPGPATITVDNSKVLTEDDIERIYTEMSKRFNKVPVIMKQECNSCGATIDMSADKHIFTCKYCGSAYAIGTAMINAME